MIIPATDSELTRALMANDAAKLQALGCTVGGAAPESDTDKPKRKSKYGAVKTVVDGITFDSKKEAARYQVLKAMQAARLIRDLELQPKFDLHATNGAKVCQYRADFFYLDTESLAAVIEDCKGIKTPMYRLKKKWLKAEYGIDIVET